MRGKLANFQELVTPDVHKLDRDWFINQFRDAGIEYHVDGSKIKIKCPYHDDNDPSLDVDAHEGWFKCFAGETLVLTDHGPRQIRDLSGGHHNVLVPVPGQERFYREWNGAWRSVEFRSFGVQQLMAVTLSRNGVKKVIRVTPEHRWFVKGNKVPRVVTSSALKKGHRLTTCFPVPANLRETGVSPFGVAHGFTFGDGSDAPMGCHTSFWGHKDHALLPYYPMCKTTPVRSQPAPEGVDGVRIVGLPRFFKTLPALDEAPSYILGFLSGYFAADGCVSEAGRARLNCADRATLETVRTLFTRVGIGATSISQQLRLGKGKAPSLIFALDLITSSIPASFFVIPEHRKRFEASTRAFERLGWVVDSVVPLDVREEVFCAVVPDVGAFTLFDNILTGNCFPCGEGGQWGKLAKKLGLEKDIEPIKNDRAGEAVAEIARALTKMGVNEHKRTQEKDRTKPLVGEWKGNWRGFRGQWLREIGCIRVDDIRKNVLRIGLPVRLFNGSLRGYTCRAIDPPDCPVKYAPLHADRGSWHDKELPAQDLLFFGDLIALNRWDRIVLVEGPIDAMRLWGLFGIPTCGLLGTGNWNATKRDILLGLGVRKFLTIMDGDRAGQDTQYKILNDLGSRAYGLTLDPGQDPDTLTPKQLIWVKKKLEAL